MCIIVTRDATKHYIGETHEEPLAIHHSRSNNPIPDN